MTEESHDGPVEELGAAAEPPAEGVANVHIEEDEEENDNEDDIPELGNVSYSESAIKDADKAALPPPTSQAASGVASTRSYDITITYDVHYSTPRVWLYGYNSQQQPLTASEWRQDFSSEHVDKTVTYEQHPHLGYSCPSIHPCKHASAMIKMVQLLGGQPLDVKYYMLIFLKFIQAMIPNMEYDYTSQFQVVDG